MPALQRLRQSDYRVMPWKNGGGTTTEIAVHPAGATLAGFDWRISLAELGGSGPFSSFPEHDRIIVQLDGEPMSLTHAERPDKTLELLVPYRFDGAWATAGRLSSAPVHDFNVMVRKGLIRSSLSVHRLEPGSVVQLLERAETVLCHVLAGAVEARLAHGAEAALAVARDSVIATSNGAETSLMLRATATCTVIVVALADVRK